jgi:hypothetical protein
MMDQHDEEQPEHKVKGPPHPHLSAWREFWQGRNLIATAPEQKKAYERRDSWLWVAWDGKEFVIADGPPRARRRLEDTST